LAESIQPPAGAGGFLQRGKTSEHYSLIMITFCQFAIYFSFFIAYKAKTYKRSLNTLLERRISREESFLSLCRVQFSNIFSFNLFIVCISGRTHKRH
jgi:predicted PurR-regulated permease PerM